MFSLSLFSSTSNVSVAIAKKSKVLKFLEITGKQQKIRSDKILELIYEILKKYDSSKISEIILPRGPGSFTTLRNLMSISQGLSITNNSKIFTLTTFDIFLPHVGFLEKGLLLFFRDSRRDFYYQFFENQNLQWIKSSRIFCGFPDDIKKKLLLYSNLRGWNNLMVVTNQYFDFSITDKKTQIINPNAKSVLKAHLLGFSSTTTRILYHLKHYAKKNQI
tara:strand:+ start:173 stop:829 length:657 start_codon:yes stop_codon:yes gene_type:complete